MEPTEQNRTDVQLTASPVTPSDGQVRYADRVGRMVSQMLFQSQDIGSSTAMH